MLRESSLLRVVLFCLFCSSYNLNLNQKRGKHFFTFHRGVTFRMNTKRKSRHFCRGSSRSRAHVKFHLFFHMGWATLRCNRDRGIISGPCFLLHGSPCETQHYSSTPRHLRTAQHQSSCCTVIHSVRRRLA